MVTVNSLKVRDASKPLVANIQAAAGDTQAKAVLDQVLRDAASVDGDRVLDAFEAQAVKDAYDAVMPSGGALDHAQAQQLQAAVASKIDAMKAARDTSTDVAFTSEGNALVVFRQKILGAIDASLAKANGKPVDINMMLFAFTDKVLADELVARCQANANLTVRIMTDWSMLADSGGKQPPRLARLNLPNLVVKFKSDAPYVWRNGGPDYDHGATTGLNHHKGFVALVDGRPEKMTLGSFNWSVGAMDGNYENLMVLDRKDVDNREVMAGYQKEFEGFWNNDTAALSYREALEHRENSYEALHRANNVPYTRRPVTAQGIVDAVYNAVDASTFFDVNSLRDRDVAALESVVGKTKAKAILKELVDYGRFDSHEELMERVPSLATLPQAKLDELAARVECGEGGLSINVANADELDRAGFSKRQADKVVAWREKYGALESLDEVADACGISKTRLKLIGINLSDDHVVGLYSARVPGQAATTGYAPEHNGNVGVTRTPDGTATAAGRPEVEARARDMATGVADMLRRAQPGQTFRLAMYGISANSPEYKEMEAAIRRGVIVRAVLYSEYNQPAIDALKALRTQGFDVDVRVISSRVMHEKFGVLEDDVWNGSANFSTSSITKHSEDRFVFKNMPSLAKRFVDEFDRLWARGRP